MVHIAVADSQFLARAGFRQLLSHQDHVSLVGEAETPQELEQILQENAPDIVVFDYFKSKAFHIDDICVIRENYPQVRFLVITADDDPGNIFQILECGVSCILTKSCSEDEIMSAIRATAREEKFFCNKVLEIILEKKMGQDDPKSDCLPSNLTAREIEVVALVAQGNATKDIADQLCLSTHTVYTHRKNIMKKLKINSVSEMVLYAVNAGIVK